MLNEVCAAYFIKLFMCHVVHSIGHFLNCTLSKKQSYEWKLPSCFVCYSFTVHLPAPRDVLAHQINRNKRLIVFNLHNFTLNEKSRTHNSFSKNKVELFLILSVC